MMNDVDRRRYLLRLSVVVIVTATDFRSRSFCRGR